MTNAKIAFKVATGIFALAFLACLALTIVYSPVFGNTGGIADFGSVGTTFIVSGLLAIPFLWFCGVLFPAVLFEVVEVG